MSIGLKGVERLRDYIEEYPDIFGRNHSLLRQVEAIAAYRPLADKIDQFWLEDTSRNSDSWAGHREINMVMLATSLAPSEFLSM
jgi:hypothetical protein